MINDKIQIKINRMKYNRLERLANWMTKRYRNKNKTELAHYIIVHHYHLEEGKAGLL